MSSITRRNFVKTAAAGLALPALGRGALAAEPLKIGYIYLGPVGDFGWTWAHEKGRKAMVEALKGQVIADYVENVKEDASAVPILKDLAQQGHKLIFTTSYGYMDQTVEVAKLFPERECSSTAPATSAPKTSATTTRASIRAARSRARSPACCRRSGTIGYLGSYKVPEVVLGVNAFTLAAQAVNPKITTKLVMIDSWFDPAKEAAAVQTLINLGCDVVAQHTDSPAGLQVCEQRKVWCFGQGADMARFAPKTQADGDRGHLGPLLHLARQGDARRHLEAGRRVVGLQGRHRGHGALQQGDARQRERGRRQDHRRLEGRLLRRLHRPDQDQSGKERLAKGERMKDADLAVIDWYVKGVQS